MVVRMRSTRSHTGNRRSHHALKAVGFVLCGNCKAPKQKHAVCEACGYYKDRKVVDMEALLKKQTKKAKEKAAAAKAQ
jgi:large subunit ribosomal protein L32